MDGTSSLQLKQNSASRHTRKRKQKHKAVDPLDDDRDDCRNNCMIEELPDDILISILSCMRIDEAMRTSVLSSRWRYLWRYMDIFTSDTLVFDYIDNETGTKMKRKKFKNLVNYVLNSYRDPFLDTLVIGYNKLGARSRHVDNWIVFAMNKEVEDFQLDLSNVDWAHCGYKFPKIEKLLSLLHEGIEAPFRSLRSLVLVDVDIEDELVRYFLESCPYIEKLCITASKTTKYLQIVDSFGYLEELEISHCSNLQSMEITALNLVYFKYKRKKIGLPFKNTPKLSELALGGDFCESFIYEPNEHSSYSVQLVDLVLNLQANNVFYFRDRTIVPPDSAQLHNLERLELIIESQVGESLLFFTSLIKASPHLQEFKIKIEYLVTVANRRDVQIRKMLSFPEVSSVEASRFNHENLKVVEMAGYCGCASEEILLVQLSKIATSLEMFVIDTRCDYFRECEVVTYRLREEGDMPMKKKQKKTTTTRLRAKTAKKHAEKFASTFPSQIKFVIT
ncbi:hypothetical protein ABFS83_09G124400 [Erythranthe nasuta]